MANKELQLTVGPFIGMNDTLNLAAQDGQRAAYLENVYSPAGQLGGDLIGRPAFTRHDFSAQARTGTINNTAVNAFNSFTLLGTSTLFLTELAVGDIITVSAITCIITAIATNTSATATPSGTTTISGAFTVFFAGIVAGQIFGELLYKNTDGSKRNYLVVATVSNLIDKTGAGKYAFLQSNISTAISGILTGTGFPNLSTTVTATGSSFTTQVVRGAVITFAPVSGEISPSSFVVGQITSNTILDTTTVNGGTGSSGGQTMIVQNGKLRLVEYDASNAAHPLTDRTSSTMNSVSLDTSQRLYGQTFANYLILSDGVNRPRKIDSSFALTNLTDANYAFHGPLVVYYGKLFGIDASDNITLRWSEENDPNTGYGTGTSDNSWSLRQTSADGLQGLAATNDALYCARQSSFAIITGAANSDFRSSGTVDAIQNIGTLSPDSLIVINASVVFRDQYGRPGRIQPGYGYVPLWKRIQEQLRGLGLTAALQMAAWCRYDPVKNTLQFAYRTTGASTTNDLMLVYDADSWECIGVHKIYASSAYAVADHAYGCIFLDENLSQRLTIASGTTADCAFYVQQTEDVQANSALEVTNGGSVTVAVKIRSPKVGGDVVQEKSFDRFVVGTRNVGGGTTGVTKWKSSYMGPYDTAFPAAKAMLIGGATTVPATATFSGACLKAEQQGVNVNGRYIQIELTNDTTGNPATRPTFDTLTVFADVNDSDYSRR